MLKIGNDRFWFRRRRWNISEVSISQKSIILASKIHDILLFFLERSENQFFGAPSAYFMKTSRFWHPNGTPWGPKWRPKSPKSLILSKVAMFFLAAGVFFRDLVFQGLRGTPLTRFGCHFGSILLHFVDLGYRFGRFGIPFCSISASEPLSFF